MQLSEIFSWCKPSNVFCVITCSLLMQRGLLETRHLTQPTIELKLWGPPEHVLQAWEGKNEEELGQRVLAVLWVCVILCLKWVQTYGNCTIVLFVYVDKQTWYCLNAHESHYTIISSCLAYSMTCWASSVEGMVTSSVFWCWVLNE